MRRPVARWLPAEMHANDYRPLPITHEHALAAAALPRHHEDPFDRMLIAQTQLEDLRIITADEQFSAYGLPLIDATA
jgi:PIN domain nuclease of toxin-antitoxin system